MFFWALFSVAQTCFLAAISNWSHLHNGVSLKKERTVSAHNFKIFKTLPTRNRRKINPWSDWEEASNSKAWEGCPCVREVGCHFPEADCAVCPHSKQRHSSLGGPWTKNGCSEFGMWTSAGVGNFSRDGGQAFEKAACPSLGSLRHIWVRKSVFPSTWGLNKSYASCESWAMVSLVFEPVGFEPWGFYSPSSCFPRDIVGVRAQL